MSNVYERLEELGLKLPKAPTKGGVYCPAKLFSENLVYISGCGPAIGEPIVGKVGQEFTKDEAKLFAQNAMLNVLTVLHERVGDLNKIKQAVKILVFVASDNDFYEQPYVANGASQLLVDIFGEEMGAPSRSAIGVNVLPSNIPVEIEAIFEIEV